MSSQASSQSHALATFGPCADCQKEHRLDVGEARAHALDLMREFEQLQRLDFLVDDVKADPRLSFAHLFADGRGSMFGVLLCEDQAGKSVVLRAFSSLRDNVRQIDGWVTPLLSSETFDDVILPAQRKIKALTAELGMLESSSIAFTDVHCRRKQTSQTLWENMCDAYRLHNFKGEQRGLDDVMCPKGSPPGGVGECCAPKLLQHAAIHRLRPLGLAEFYWGASQSAGRRVPGEFYGSCEARCRPILGFMLCGVEGLDV
ncbi:MAG: hypothetical protein GY822_04675 [Deltaproteobacteria bacterium]|nr:hypothetical protein [Deltaproteobacteria bacterium]